MLCCIQSRWFPYTVVYSEDVINGLLYLVTMVFTYKYFTQKLFLNVFMFSVTMDSIYNYCTQIMFLNALLYLVTMVSIRSHCTKKKCLIVVVFSHDGFHCHYVYSDKCFLTFCRST